MEPAQTTATATRDLSIGDTLSEAWNLYTRFFGRFVLIALVVYAVLGLLEAIVSTVSDDGNTLGLFFWAIVSLVVSLVGYFWLQGTLVEAVRDVRDGRADESVGELFAKVRPRLPALIAAGVLAAIGVGVGLVLLVIPGLFLLTRWVLIVPVIVLEGRSAGEAFGRSWELVKGHSWTMFGLILVTLIGLGIVSSILTGIVAAILDFLGTFLSTWLTTTVVNSLVAPFVALAWTVAYYRLTGGGTAAGAKPEPAP